MLFYDRPGFCVRQEQREKPRRPRRAVIGFPALVAGRSFDLLFHVFTFPFRVRLYSASARDMATPG